MLNPVPGIRLIALDLDGTLLNTSRVLSQTNIEALQAAQSMGFIMCLASGRAISTVAPFAQEAQLRGPMVTANGAYVVDKDGNEILHKGLGAEAIKWLLNFADQRNLHVNHYHKGTITMNKGGEWADLYRERVASDKVEVLIGGFNESEATKLLYVGHKSDMDMMEAEVKKSLPAGWAEVVRSEAEYLEFLPTGISKGWGLSQLAARLGVSREETAALGDYSNDKEMLEWAGFPGAMGNALPEIKSLAKVVVGRNDENGAAQFLNLLMDQARND